MVAGRIAHALETKARIPVLWYHGNECTCCSESFLRSGHPLVSDVVLSMINLEYDDVIMAAAGHQAEAIPEKVIKEHAGNYVLCVEGNPPLKEDGMYCFVGGKPFVENLRRAAAGARFVIAWGHCASWGCVQAAKPNPVGTAPVHKVVVDRPVIKVPGCPPVAEVMTGILSYVLTFDQLPALDRQGRPRMFYSQRLHDKCYRRGHFDAGQFAEAFDDEGARKGYCLYKLGCRGPVTYNACSTVGWNGGVSWPVGSGHPCIGCSEENFWDRGPFYRPVENIRQFGVESSADDIGAAAAAVVGVGVAIHAGMSAVKRAIDKKQADKA
jgi:hydrogenase small subunit